MQRLAPALFLFLLAATPHVVAFGGSGLPLPGGWVELPLVLSVAAIVFLLRNQRGRRFLGRLVVVTILAGVAAFTLVTQGGRIWLIGAAMMVFSPWLLLIALLVGVWRYGPTEPRDDGTASPHPSAGPVTEVDQTPRSGDADRFPATRPFDHG